MTTINEFKNALKESKNKYYYLRDWVTNFETYDYDVDELIDFTRFFIKKLIKFDFSLDVKFELGIYLDLLEKIEIDFIYDAHFSNHRIINLFWKSYS